MYANRSIANWQRSRKRTRRAELVLRIRGSAYNSVLLLISDKTLNVRLYFSLSLPPLPPLLPRKGDTEGLRAPVQWHSTTYTSSSLCPRCSYTFFWFRGETIERPFHASASSRFSWFEFHIDATRREYIYIYCNLPFIILFTSTPPCNFYYLHSIVCAFW